MSEILEKFCKLVWDYHIINEPLVKSDMIVCFCSNDLRVADYCAELWHAKWAPKIIFSGGLGRGTAGKFLKSEAELFAERAMELGVDADSIIIERNSTNTGENIEFCKKEFCKLGIKVKRIILAQKPYMQRRAFATLQVQWPGVDFVVGSPNLDFENYPNDEISKEEVINFMVGDLQRIIEYPLLGYQSYQEVPLAVVEAMEGLLAAGFNKYALKRD
ncbi:MAG: YdcF family protein [Lentisphaeria bacterium]